MGIFKKKVSNALGTAGPLDIAMDVGTYGDEMLHNNLQECACCK